MIVSVMTFSHINIGREEDTPAEVFRFNGQEAIGLEAGMRQGDNIVDCGAELDAVIKQAISELPVGIETMISRMEKGECRSK